MMLVKQWKNIPSEMVKFLSLKTVKTLSGHGLEKPVLASVLQGGWRLAKFASYFYLSVNWIWIFYWKRRKSKTYITIKQKKVYFNPDISYLCNFDLIAPTKKFFRLFWSIALCFSHMKAVEKAGKAALWRPDSNSLQLLKSVKKALQEEKKFCSCKSV